MSKPELKLREPNSDDNLELKIENYKNIFIGLFSLGFVALIICICGFIALTSILATILFIIHLLLFSLGTFIAAVPYRKAIMELEEKQENIRRTKILLQEEEKKRKVIEAAEHQRQLAIEYEEYIKVRTAELDAAINEFKETIDDPSNMADVVSAVKNLISDERLINVPVKQILRSLFHQVDKNDLFYDLMNESDCITLAENLFFFKPCDKYKSVIAINYLMHNSPYTLWVDDNTYDIRDYAPKKAKDINSVTCYNLSFVRVSDVEYLELRCEGNYATLFIYKTNDDYERVTVPAENAKYIKNRLEHLIEKYRKDTIDVSNTDNKQGYKDVVDVISNGLIHSNTKGCYIIRNKENNKCYVGQSKDVAERLKQHFNKDGSPKNIIFAEDFYTSQYNPRNRIFEVAVIPAQTKDELDDLERRLIEEYDAFRSGYNGTSGNK